MSHQLASVQAGAADGFILIAWLLMLAVLGGGVYFIVRFAVRAELERMHKKESA